MARPSDYTLEESASILRMHRATLRHWTELFGDRLGLRPDCRGNVRFEERHLRTMVGIHQMLVKERRSLEDVRNWIEKMLGNDGSPPAGLDNVLLDEGARRPGSETFKEMLKAGVGGDPGHIETESVNARMRHDGPDAKINELLLRVSILRESVDYLADENRALQELMGRLIRYVETLSVQGKESRRTKQSRNIGSWRPAALPEDAPNGTGSDATPMTHAMARPRTVKPWRPRKLTPEEKRALVRAGRA